MEPPAGAETSDPPDGLAVVWSPVYEMEIGDHVFPTEKYRLVLEELLADGTIAREHVHRPGPAADEDLRRVHTPAYVEKLRDDRFSRHERWRMEIPFSPEIRRAFRTSCGGSILTGRLALRRRMAVHLGGGFHHAFPDHAEGFCLLNDVAVALRTLESEASLQRATVIDCDVHHGNGTAAIFSDDDRVHTLSLHQEGIYPVRKPPGDRDVGLPARTGDRRYLEALREVLPEALEEHEPDLAFYLAGADPYRGDQLGGLDLTREGLERRDREVLGRCRAEGVPVAMVLAGGYAHRLKDTVEIHSTSVRVAKQIYRHPRAEYTRDEQ